MPLKTKKIILSITLLCFVSIGFLVAFPKAAEAQFLVSDPPLEAAVVAANVKKEVKESIGAAILQTGTIALVNAANYFVQKIAYDMATWIASAGPGQKPLFDGRGFGDYVADVGKSAAMKFARETTDAAGLRKLGFDFCAPNLKLLAKVKVGFLKAIGPPEEPDCSWKQMVGNWEAFGSSFATGEVLKNFGAVFEPGQSDLGFAFEFNNRVLVEVATKEDNASKERQASGGWQSVKDFISGKVTTPSDQVKKSFEKSYQDNPADTQTASFSAFGNALGQGAYAILPAALSSFTNTLLSTAFKRLQSGIFSAYDLLGDDSDASIYGGDAGSATPAVGRRNAQAIYSDLIKPKILTSSNYDPLIEFTTCTDNEDEKQINNCVVDDSFAAAVRQANQGTPLSISEALKGGYIDGGKPLIASSDARNQKNNCYQEGYCYSNLVKLRKARILPVGFELAAELMSGGTSENLQKVVDNFYNCNTSGGRDAEHPYCHLIDPNWVLKLPKTQCQARVYGPTLVSSAANFRAEICADPATCISEDESGNCVGGFGYCTKEKNIWKISAETCGEQYNTCLTYKSRDNKPVNYIKNTVNFDSCFAENAGCRAYSANKKSGNWSGALGDAIYFNKDLEKCDASAAGCSELYSKANGLAYNLIPNPSFENVSGAKNIAGWLGGANLIITNDSANVFDGVSAVNPAGNLLMDSSGLIKLELNTAYNFSGYVKGAAANSSYRLALSFYDAASGASQYIFDPANLVSTCAVNPESRTVELAGRASVDGYTRVSCAFLTPNQTLYAKALVSGASWFDAIQLEEGSSATTFLASGYGAVLSVNIKIAPNYLDCQAGGTNPECANYAPSCRADEAGCQNYTPKDNSPAISGVATVNDICPAACVGYETYKQDATVFEPDKFPNYLIPSTAKVCGAQDAGCDEFTNLENEAKEYFSAIRQCIKPNPAEDAVFYTWEGSDQTGFQLKSHKLKIEPGTASNPAPAYIPNVDSALCAKIIFQAKIGDPNYNPDCREFYNAKGTVSYRLLSKTIISTEDCVDYRKTDSNQFSCVSSGGDWDNAAQFCVYKGYKTESRVCAAAANNCRAYSGAASANLRLVFQDDFESGNNGWTGGAVSPESLAAGGHSLKGAASPSISKDLNGLVSANGTYTASFWAKAPAGGKLTVNFANTGASFNPGANIVDTKSDWRFYEIGPFNLSPSISGASLQIALTGGTGFYIDNIILKEASQKLYLIKNSWNTPASCDQTLNGLYLPQAQLGCKEYADANQQSAYFKSFGSLCRPEAAGCAAFIDTKNSKTDKNEIYNAICALGHRVVFGGEDCKYNNETVCAVGAGADSCRFKITDGALPSKLYQEGAAAGAYKDASTAEVPKDKTVYIVADKKYYCQPKDLGCSAFGQGELYTTPNATTVYYKNNPEKYDTLLCAAEAEGCESWTSNKGVDYFKVPTKTCEYRDGGAGAGGWFKKGADTPCYPNVLQNGVNGIWRNADVNYDGSVGICPDKQNGCTEFIDPLGTSAKNKSGKPYYLLDNDKLKALENDESCGGKASLEAGCILFNKTSDPALKWNAGASYSQASQEKKLVAPVAAEPNNSNTILKVTRDRECGEWLACKSSYTAYDPITNKAKSVCAELGLCDKYQTSGAGSSFCANFIISNPDSAKILDVKNYSERKIGWNEKDYSGFSLGNKYPISDAEVLGGVLQANGKTLNGGGLAESALEKSVCRGFPEQDSPFPYNIGTWDINGRLQNISAAGLQNANICDYGQDCNCDYTKLIYGNKATLKYTEYGNRSVPTGVCQGGSRDGLSCVPGVVYDEDPRQACGKPEEGGTCLKLQRQDDVIGWSGYCLERDLSTPINGDKNQKACLTWLPQDIVPGGRDIYNQFRTAGYTPPIGGGKYYCLQASGNYSAVSANKATKYANLLVTNTTYNQALSSTSQIEVVKPSGCGAGKAFWSKTVVGTGLAPAYCATGCSGNSRTACIPSQDIDLENDISAEKTLFIANNIGGEDEDGVGFIKTFNNPMTAVGVITNSANKKDLEAKPVYKNDIDLIEIKAGTEPYAGQFAPGSVFYIRSNQKITNYMAFGGVCDDKTTNNCSGESAGSNTLKGQARAKSLINGDDWYFRHDTASGSSNNRDFIDIDLFSIGDAAALNSYCAKNSTGEFKQYAYALKFHFNNATGLLESLSVAYCSSRGHYQDDGKVALGIYIHKREVCEKVVDVAASENNMANTQRLWKYNPDNAKDKIISPYQMPYTYNYEIQPFGSAAKDTAPLTTPAAPWYSYYTVGKNNFAGVPWSCRDNCGAPRVSDDDSETIDFNPMDNMFPTNVSLFQISKQSADTALSYIKNIFAKVFKFYIWSYGDRKYKETDCDNIVKPVGDFGWADSSICIKPSASASKKPLIFSYDPLKKFVDNGQYPLDQANKIVINDATSASLNIKSGQYTAVMRFYAWADTSQMPLKSIKVDWDGDGNYDVATSGGFYKNHKPRCAQSNDNKNPPNVCSVYGQIVCKQSSECPYISTLTSTAGACSGKGMYFGNSPEACDEAYFEIQHTYTCNVATGCSYTPKVSVIDNWGIASDIGIGPVITLTPQ
jgi:hypothetical protein